MLAESNYMTVAVSFFLQLSSNENSHPVENKTRDAGLCAKSYHK
jgi:hypothetical protein